MSAETAREERATRFLTDLARQVEQAKAGVDWQARAETAETKLDAVHEYCHQYRSVEGMDLACDDILDIISTDEEVSRG